MKTTRRLSFILISAIGAAGVLVGNVQAATNDLVNVQIIGSTTYSGTQEGYTSNITAANNATVYYAVEVQMGAIGNSDNSKTISTLPYGTAGVLSLSYNLTDSLVTFNADNQVQAPFSDSSLAYSNGTVGATPAVSNSKETVPAGSGIADVVGSINTSTNPADSPQGVSGAGNAPALALVQVGSLVNGATTSVIQGSYGTTSGVFKINNGASLSGNNITVTNGDPSAYYEFDPLTITESTPEPASLGLLGLGGLAMMRRRRTSTATRAKA